MSLPPLVEPGDPLTPEEIERYSRQVIIPGVGMDGQRRLKNAKVLVIGAGGLGSPILMYLAAAGVGTLGILDFDTVESSNLQRQVIHRVADIGRPKTLSAAETVAAVNPLVRVRLHTERLHSGNALQLIDGYHLVLDGTDNFPTRYLVNDACVLAGTPYVWGSILQFEGQLSVFWARHGPQYRDLHPVPPPPGSVPSCADGGVLGMLCATIGSLMATEAVKLICGIGVTLLGRLLTYDALQTGFRTVNLRRDPDGLPITGLSNDGEFWAGGPPAAQDTEDLAAHTISAIELKRRLDTDEQILMVDVREPEERDIVRIEGSVLIRSAELVSGRAISQLPSDRLIVLHCKSGGRSAEALRAMRGAGLTDVVHLGGGILAWIEDVDPTLARY